MGRVLQDIYSDITIASLIGFKGGTCAYFFYELPRFSAGAKQQCAIFMIFGFLLRITAIIEKVKDNEILRGLGELISEKEKAWVKMHLRKRGYFIA